MQTITLKPLQHRGAEQIGIYFSMLFELNNEISKIGGRWSSTNKCFYIPCTEEAYKKSEQTLKDKAEIDNEELRKYLQQRKKEAGVQKKKAINVLPVSKTHKIVKHDTKVPDIDSDRMQIKIENAKGKKDRMATLAKATLEILMIYFKEYKPKNYLFEGQEKGEPYNVRSAQKIFTEAYKNLNLPLTLAFTV